VKTYLLRLHPGEDLKQVLVAYAEEHGLQAGLVLTCVGSLVTAALRMADRPETTTLTGKFEIVSLVGTLGPQGPHLHMAISDGEGRTYGGHLQDGSRIYTTAEIVLGDLEEWVFEREIDPETTYDELVRRKRE
jgi:uncharacterized protein